MLDFVDLDEMCDLLAGGKVEEEIPFPIHILHSSLLSTISSVLSSNKQRISSSVRNLINEEKRNLVDLVHPTNSSHFFLTKLILPQDKEEWVSSILAPHLIQLITPSSLEENTSSSFNRAFHLLSHCSFTLPSLSIPSELVHLVTHTLLSPDHPSSSKGHLLVGLGRMAIRNEELARDITPLLTQLVLTFISFIE